MELLKDFTKKYLKKNVPDLRSGDVVKIHQKIKEGAKERVQVFEGIVIKVHNKTDLNSTFTVRRVAYGVGIEKTFPMHSPTIIKIEKVKSIKMRRSRLYFLRDVVGKRAKKRKEFKELGIWEEPEAEKELEKIEEEKAKEAEEKEARKEAEEKELEKKFAETRGESKAEEIVAEKDMVIEENKTANKDDSNVKKEVEEEKN